MKRFNVTGTCLPKKHYMVDTSKKIKQIVNLIEDDQYFTINRARQYGKTTTFLALEKELSGKYYVISISFEGICEDSFVNNYTFVKKIIDLIARGMRWGNVTEDIISKWEDITNLSKSSEDDAFDFLSIKITNLCQIMTKRIVLMIDEVDKTSNNQVFLNFLGMLRDKYLLQARGKDTSFKSVILAGVHDIKNLKRKIKSRGNSVGDTGEGSFNSPWNIAADFEVDMSFHPEEIATMLRDYEEDHHTGMDIKQISEEIYKYTNGYPYLVSRICQRIDEKFDKDWTVEGIKKVIKEMIKGRNTLFDDLIKNIDLNEDLYLLVREILENGYKPGFSLAKQAIQIGHMYGILREQNGYTVIDNPIFELYLHEYIAGKLFLEKEYVELRITESQFIRGSKLDMEQILSKFQELLRQEYRKGSEKFVEKNFRLLFLCFLKPIINGIGFYYVEPEVRNDSRMDLVVTYGKEEYIIELKIWHGEQYRKDGIKQLEKYLKSRHTNRGYLVSFSFNKKDKQTAGMISKEETDMEIFEVVI